VGELRIGDDWENDIGGAVVVCDDIVRVGGADDGGEVVERRLRKRKKTPKTKQMAKGMPRPNPTPIAM
jgi:hypothetical protein